MAWKASARKFRAGRAQHFLCKGVMTLAVIAMSLSTSAYAEDSLADLSIEELLAVEVTSVSKRSERRVDAPAAVYLISQDDIRRSGATSIPEALRGVPGLHVARLDANKWSITSRGFSGRYANKLLVLIDGRSVYTPNFAGVVWESQDLLMEDVDRIEVIRGPGGTLWGANAVNGVINIVTKSAKETHGGLLVLGGGTEERAFTGFRYGGGWKDKLHYRFYGKYFERDDYRFRGGGEANDYWDSGQGGFRLDWKLDDEDSFTLQGDAYRQEAQQTTGVPSLKPPLRRPTDNTSFNQGANILGRWTHSFANGSDLQLQLYIDHFDTEDSTILAERRNTYDVDLQYHFTVGDRHDIVWGVGFRYVADDLAGTQLASYDPSRRGTKLYSGFIQDEINFYDGEVKLTLGAKLEYNDFTGLEVQPSARVSWTPTENQTLWASVSRAVRTPSRTEDSIHLVDRTLPFRIALVLEGTRDYDSEELLAYEIGYRRAFNSQFAVDIAAFLNDYEGLRSIEVIKPQLSFRTFPPHFAIVAEARNNLDALTYGVEIGADWHPKSWWHVRASYSFLEVDLDLHPKTIDFISGATQDDTPEQQFHIRNSFNLAKSVQLDTTLRWVDRLPSLDVDDYWTLDLRLGWKPRENLELSLVGQNLFEPAHSEFSPTFVNSLPTQVERGVYAKLEWRF